jgi:hypothetical protein
MDREEIEALLQEMLEAGEIETGLFNAGQQFVVVDRVDDELLFAWFDEAWHLDQVLANAR